MLARSCSLAKSGLARSSTVCGAFRFSLKGLGSMSSGQTYGPKWWTEKDVAVVTGTNKGIGKEIARLLAEQGLTVIATARQKEAGKATVEEIAKATGAGDRVQFHQLDLTSPKSIKNFAEWLNSTFGGLAILVNNAGFAYKGDAFGSAELEETLAINYYGTVQLTEALLPYIKPGEGRVVFVSSRAGLLQICKDKNLQDRFLNAKSKEEIDTLLDEFKAVVAKNDAAALASSGWPCSMYGVSKLALTHYSRQLGARQEGQGIKVAACCPGYVKTEMSSHKGHLTPTEGADTPVWLATLPAEQLESGKLWAERRVHFF